jgi:hypothetical protein
MIVAVRMNGKFIRIKKAPYETDDRAMARAWWVAHNPEVQDKPQHERECLSLLWAYEKYDNMKYNDIVR